MKTFVSFLFYFCFISSAIAASPTPQWRAAAPQKGTTVESRLARIERLLDNQALLDLTMQLDTLQREVSEMRGQLEKLNFDYKRINDQQRQTYIDLDGRLQGIESKLSSISGRPILKGSPGDEPKGTEPPQVYDPEQARIEYQNSFNLIKAGRYDAAMKSLGAFVQKYSRSEYAGNAQYWLGELNFVKRNFKVAITEFDKVVTQFPKSKKVHDAMLKRGFSYYELSDWNNARKSLTDITRVLPGNSTIAKLARERLKKMKKEGH